MSPSKLTRWQAAVAIAIRKVGLKLDQGGFVPNSIAHEICCIIFGYRANTTRVHREIENFNQRILSRDVTNGRFVSRRTPKPSEVNGNTPEPNRISDERLTTMADKVKNKPRVKSSRRR